MQLEYNKGILFIRLKGKLDRVISKKINYFLVPKVLEQKIKYVVINLYEVTDIDIYGLDSLLNLKCAVKSIKGKICLCETSKIINQKINHFQIERVENEMKAFDMIGSII